MAGAEGCSPGGALGDSPPTHWGQRGKYKHLIITYTLSFLDLGNVKVIIIGNYSRRRLGGTGALGCSPGGALGDSPPTNCSQRQR